MMSPLVHHPLKPRRRHAAALAALGLVALVLHGPALGQRQVVVPPLTPPLKPTGDRDLGPMAPTPAQTEQVRRELPSPGAIQGGQLGIQVPLVQLPSGRAAGLPPKAVDLADLVRQYEGMGAARGNTQRRSGDDAADRQVSGVVLFASLGMPKASLDRLIDDASRLRAPIVLRGLVDGSLGATRRRIAEAMGERLVAWQIDPTLFSRFDVSAVPALVLVDPAQPIPVECKTDQCRAGGFAKVAGDVTAEYALRLIAERDPDPGLASVARRAIDSLTKPRP